MQLARAGFGGRMNARIHLKTASDWLNVSFNRSFLPSEIEDAFWLAVHDDRTYAAGEVSPSHLDRPIEVCTDDGEFDHAATNRLIVRMVEFLR
jgi:hypothetical protein